MKSHLPSSIIPLFHRILLPFPIPMQYPFPFPIPISPLPPFPPPIPIPISHFPFHFPFPFPLSTIPTATATTETATSVFSLLLKNWFILCKKSHYGAGGGYNHFAGSYTQLMLLSPVSLRLYSAVEFPHCAGSLGIQRLSQSTPVQSS
ncbi:hypothetical protein ES332_A12G206100v1 [Gossypium tomentosum]|uniref:Uncharacterized protein n=1 Tax=Gossypium tomentosum TaxID=34277 RepID=A0A5D2N0M2_GOSTO|nr:hypothetical protein ES332_A12G206100v1 [Gossypium tomentosum]